MGLRSVVQGAGRAGGATIRWTSTVSSDTLCDRSLHQPRLAVAERPELDSLRVELLKDLIGLTQRLAQIERRNRRGISDLRTRLRIGRVLSHLDIDAGGQAGDRGPMVEGAV